MPLLVLAQDAFDRQALMRDLVRVLRNDQLDYNQQAVAEWSRSSSYPRGGRRAVPDPKGGFYVERGIVDGAHEVTRPGVYGRPWLNMYQWDYLVYMNARANPTNGRVWTRANAAARAVGIPPNYRSRTCLHRPMIRRGFLQEAEPRDDGIPRWTVMLLPQRVLGGYRRSSLPRTMNNFEAEHRPYFWMPGSLMATEGPWKQLGNHGVRRLLTALYAYNDLPLRGGVDPNHLRIEIDDDFSMRLVSSVEFASSAAAGDALPNLLHELHDLSFVGIIPVRTRSDGPPSGPTTISYLEDGDTAASILVVRPRWQEPAGYRSWQNRVVALDSLR
ncbi:MAG: hypothetical protein Q7W51_04975 [Coriobacteriia bacterium]|nr:hypothetical protein [Coriobacteriia bacterium]